MKPVDVEKGKTVVLDRIVIPKIQRPYAQGRSDGVSTFVRNSFLEEIFESLTSGEIMDLNFVYGIIRSDDKENIMELLDGQQRLTTLFLVYWYVANCELEYGSRPPHPCVPSQIQLRDTFHIILFLQEAF